MGTDKKVRPEGITDEVMNQLTLEAANEDLKWEISHERTMSSKLRSVLEVKVAALMAENKTLQKTNLEEKNVQDDLNLRIDALTADKNLLKEEMSE